MVLVGKKGLDGADIVIGLQEMGGEAAAEDVGRIRRVMQKAKLVRFFTITNDREISEIAKEDLTFENGMEKYKNDF